MHRLNLLIFVFGIIWSGLAYAEDEDRKELGLKDGMVLVEQGISTTSEVKEEYSLLPYRDRRPRWGSTYSVGYSSYEPVNYDPDFVTASFSDIYKSPDLPLIELAVAMKRNMKIGSLGFELGVGIYRNNSDNTDLSDSSLQVIPVRLGLVLALDTLTPNPYLVPYAGAGAYTMVFKEELAGGSSNNGNTQAALYFHGGLQMSLGWIDPTGARLAYQESGVEGTFIYAEVQSYMASSNVADGDFSNTTSYAGGLRLEF